MVERVVAIVSRVQGLYEFDVQTLREYFAARHLYETAPYSPAGDERRGTISDRWRALSRNYYWLNVARFYAGCYSEGELPSLVDDLRALSSDEIFRWTSHPQLLASTLLGDWVFSQRPRATQDAVDLLVEPRGFRLLVAGAVTGFRRVEDVYVGDPIGRDRLIAACKELVRPNRSTEDVVDVVWSAIHPNASPEGLFDWWIEELCSADDTQVRHWCMLGEHLHCWSVISLDTVSELLDRRGIPVSSVLTGLLHANRTDILESSEEIFGAAVDAVLSGELVGLYHNDSLLEQVTWTFESMYLGMHLPGEALAGNSLLDHMSQYRGYQRNRTDGTWPCYDTAASCARLVEAFKSEAERPVTDWQMSLEPWERFIQLGVAEFGERKRFVELASLAAGIRSIKETCTDSPSLFDLDRPLVRRFRYARLRAGSRKWWSDQLSSVSNADDVWTALLLFATWAGSRTIESLIEVFDELVIALDVSAWYRLHATLRRTLDVNSSRVGMRPLGIRMDELPSSLSARTIVLLAERCTPEVADELCERYLTDHLSDDPIVVSLRTDVLIRRALENETKWPQAIENLRLNHSLGAPTSRVVYESFGLRLTLPDTVAREIVDQPLEFPAALVWTAENSCRQLDAPKILAVGKAATAEGWFA